MPPKLTPLFHPESDEEAEKVIQEAEDAKVQLACMNAGLVKFNWKAEAARATKSKQQWEWQRLAKEQAKQDQHVETEEKAEREQQEQQAELAHVNWEVSPKVFRNLAFDLANSWTGSCKGTCGAGGWAIKAQK